MSWVLEHLQLVIVVGSAIAYWLNQRRKAREERQMAELTQQPVRENIDSAEQAERTRRIQEEIRRKILERVSGGTRTQLPQPPPLVERPLVRTSVPVREADEDAAATEAQAGADRAVLERQQQLAEKLRELEDKRREYAGRAEEFAVKTKTAIVPLPEASRGNLLAELRAPSTARRAIVLREVLGTPVGLR